MSETKNQTKNPEDQARQDGEPTETASALKPLLWVAIPLVALLVYGVLTAH